MKHFILNKDGQSLDISDYLKRSNLDSDFVAFVRCEALGEKPKPKQKEAKPKYLNPSRRLGFGWDQNADIGHAQYNYKANLMKRLVEKYARQLVYELPFPIYEVGGGNMFSLKHPVVEAYASLYGDRLYQFKSGKSSVVMSYDASYPQFNLANSAQLSYKKLPFAHFSLADCYRHEQSGEIMLLYRQRRFYMPDIHPYFKDIDQAFQYFPKLQDKIIEAGQAANRQYQVLIEVPSDRIYHEYSQHIKKIPKWLESDVLVIIKNDNQDRYWVVNVDYNIVDALGQPREIGCIQVDIGNASRLGIDYVDKDGNSQHPVIIHSAIPGGLERYLYIMLDNFEAGLPSWIQPVHIRLLPVGDKDIAISQKLIEELSDLPLRIEVDDRSVSLSSKIKLSHEDLIPHGVVIGPSEAQNNFAELRQLSKRLTEEVNGMPFIKRGWPAELSRRI